MRTTVLIADDSAFTRELLRESLGEAHEVVGEARNGIEAVDLYRECNPDLVIMDIIMPILDGIEATEQIKDADANATVIMCTSVGQDEAMRAATKAGADGYLTKPFTPPGLMRVIREAVSPEA